MNAQKNSDSDPETHQRVADATQEAIDATAHAYAAAPELDVEEHLRAEIDSRGIVLDDSSWLTEAAGHIREGKPVVVGESDGSVTP